MTRAEELRHNRHRQMLERLKELIDNLEILSERMKSDPTWSENAKTAIESESERLGTIHSTFREVYEK